MPARIFSMKNKTVTLYNVMRELIERFRKKDKLAVFHVPVDATLVPEYYKLIKSPMDFSTMEQKLKANEYKSLDHFAMDIELICSNATFFNSHTTLYYKEAVKMTKFSKEAISIARALLEDAVVNGMNRLSHGDGSKESDSEDNDSPHLTSNSGKPADHLVTVGGTKITIRLGNNTASDVSTPVAFVPTRKYTRAVYKKSNLKLVGIENNYGLLPGQFPSVLDLYTVWNREQLLQRSTRVASSNRDASKCDNPFGPLQFSDYCLVNNSSAQNRYNASLMTFLFPYVDPNTNPDDFADKIASDEQLLFFLATNKSAEITAIVNQHERSLIVKKDQQDDKVRKEQLQIQQQKEKDHELERLRLQMEKDRQMKERKKKPERSKPKKEKEKVKEREINWKDKGSKKKPSPKSSDILPSTSQPMPLASASAAAAATNAHLISSYPPTVTSLPQRSMPVMPQSHQSSTYPSGQPSLSSNTLTAASAYPRQDRQVSQSSHYPYNQYYYSTNPQQSSVQLSSSMQDTMQNIRGYHPSQVQANYSQSQVVSQHYSQVSHQRLLPTSNPVSQQPHSLPPSSQPYVQQSQKHSMLPQKHSLPVDGASLSNKRPRIEDPLNNRSVSPAAYAAPIASTSLGAPCHNEYAPVHHQQGLSHSVHSPGVTKVASASQSQPSYPSVNPNLPTSYHSTSRQPLPSQIPTSHPSRPPIQAVSSIPAQTPQLQIQQQQAQMQMQQQSQLQMQQQQPQLQMQQQQAQLQSHSASKSSLPPEVKAAFDAFLELSKGGQPTLDNVIDRLMSQGMDKQSASNSVQSLIKYQQMLKMQQRMKQHHQRQNPPQQPINPSHPSMMQSGHQIHQPIPQVQQQQPQQSQHPIHQPIPQGQQQQQAQQSYQLSQHPQHPISSIPIQMPQQIPPQHLHPQVSATPARPIDQMQMQYSSSTLSNSTTATMAHVPSQQKHMYYYGNQQLAVPR